MKEVDLRNKYIEFFESKGHVRIPSAPVVPENDPSVLFNTAGMQPLVPYLKRSTTSLWKKTLWLPKMRKNKWLG